LSATRQSSQSDNGNLLRHETEHRYSVSRTADTFNLPRTPIATRRSAQLCAMSSTIDTVPYRQAFERIRAEYAEMPGMRLTAAQVKRLSGVGLAVCRQVLDDLVRARFLEARPDGSYSRAAESNSRLATASANPIAFSSRRVSNHHTRSTSPLD
jgi:hypothetical protein